MIDGTALNDRPYLVTIPLRITEPFEQHHAPAFAPAITISSGIKGLTAPIDSEGIHLGERDIGHRRQGQIHAAGQGQITFTQAQTLTGQVQGNQRRGTGGINRQRRPLQPQGVGQSPGRGAVTATGGHVGIQFG